jgi:hypothetical protein
VCSLGLVWREMEAKQLAAVGECTSRCVQVDGESVEKSRPNAHQVKPAKVEKNRKNH